MCSTYTHSFCQCLIDAQSHNRAEEPHSKGARNRKNERKFQSVTRAANKHEEHRHEDGKQAHTYKLHAIALRMHVSCSDEKERENHIYTARRRTCFKSKVFSAFSWSLSLLKRISAFQLFSDLFFFILLSIRSRTMCGLRKIGRKRKTENQKRWPRQDQFCSTVAAADADATCLFCCLLHHIFSLPCGMHHCLLLQHLCYGRFDSGDNVLCACSLHEEF